MQVSQSCHPSCVHVTGAHVPYTHGIRDTIRVSRSISTPLLSFFLFPFSVCPPNFKGLSKYVTNKTCLLCGWTYHYRPSICKHHLGVPGDAGTSHVQMCKPFADHVESLAQIVKELKERHDHDKIQGRETARDRYRVRNLTIRWTWICLAKRLVLLSH